MQTGIFGYRCVWCNHILDPSNSMEMAYDCCSNCLYPLPTE